MDMISESYFTTIVWESSLNYYSKLHFIIHLHDFGNLTTFSPLGVKYLVEVKKYQNDHYKMGEFF